MTMHVIDYEIIGDDLQFVEVELDPGEAAVGEAGAMMYMQDGVSMDTVFGDGSAQEGGWMGKLFGAGKRLLTGESMFTTVFVNEGQGKKRVAFAAASPGKIVPVHLRELGGALLAQKDAFLCAAKQAGAQPALKGDAQRHTLGGEGLFFATLTGPGHVWLQSLPFSRLADRILSQAPAATGSKSSD